MKNSVQLLLLLCFTLLNANLFAQHRNCSAMHVLEQQIQANPERAAALEEIERHTEQWKNSGKRVDGIITIPTVVHIVYANNTQNISDAQVASQMQVLNDDFRRLNSDADGTWAQAIDTEIEFCLASVDPNGNPTNGITRTSSSVSAHGTDDSMKYTAQGGKDAWPADQYLNMWVCGIGGGILGYAQFPGGNDATDGVVMDYQYFGTIGTATSPFDLGRTATHEVGHWLNLRHIWGDGNCNADDFVSDTPSSDAANYGCASTHSSCNSLDMVQNYMDYSDDSCMNLFTAGQKARMRALFDTGGAKESLLSSTACGPPAEPTCDDGIQNGDETGVDCGGSSCANACPTCTDGIQNGDETAIDCGGSSCQACPCTGSDVVISITFDNYPEETSWTLADANGATVASGGVYTNATDGSTLTENLCLADGCYDFTISDVYGDGICCQYGNGSYSVTSNGSALVSGATFTNNETTNFCVGGTPPTPTCTDGVMNGDETGVDCGGSCTACATCDDGIQNQGETGVDCGGPCDACPPDPTCNDGVQNQGETGVDCGGPCAACPTCNDGIQNQGETGVDCGGPCDACPPDPTCTDGIQNQGETGVDCGGPCAPCNTGCTDVALSITFDNYPEETSWSITDTNGATVASGGVYTNQADGSTLNLTECLADGCYDFTINDVYGDGMCCAYGNGSYSVSTGGATVASGGSFSATETTNFCIGGTPPTPTCTDGVMNGDETGVDCGGSCSPCTAAPTCTDGIMNGDETGVDCGGSCAPCNTGECTYSDINEEGFESGWGIWNDGGSDCFRSSSSQYANNGTYSARLRDNTSTSVATTDNLDLSSYEELTVDFSYIGVSMENGEDFWLQVSTNGGSSYTTVGDWNRGIEFANNVRENESVVIEGPFTSNTRLRFRCDASGNSDWVYIDDVVISGCGTSGARIISGADVATAAVIETAAAKLSNVTIYPNPAQTNVNITFDATIETTTNILVTDIRGSQVYQSATTSSKVELNTNNWTPGVYIVHLVNGTERVAKKLVIQ